MRVKFTDTEKSPEVLSGAVASRLMLQSRLDKDDLSKIWKMSTKSGATITKQEFFLALKLIALLQNGLEINPQNLSRFTFYPKLDDSSLPVQKTPIPVPVTPSPMNETPIKPPHSEFADLQISDENLKRIESYIESKCRTKQKGILTRAESVELLRIGGFNPAETNQLWEAFDIDKKDFLNRGQLIALLFYISLRKNKQPVPFFVPPKIVKFIRDYNEKYTQSDSNRNIVHHNTPPVQNVAKNSVEIEELSAVIRKIAGAIKFSENSFKQEKQKQESLVASFANQILRLSSVDQGFENLNKLILEQIAVVDECLLMASSEVADKVDQKNQYEAKILSLVSKQKETFDEKMKAINSGLQKVSSTGKELETVIDRVSQTELQKATRPDLSSVEHSQKQPQADTHKTPEENNDEFQNQHAKVNNATESNKSIPQEISRKHSSNSQDKSKPALVTTHSQTNQTAPKTPDSNEEQMSINESTEKKTEEPVPRPETEIQETLIKSEVNTSMNPVDADKDNSPNEKNGSQNLFEAGAPRMKSSGIFTSLLMRESMISENENKKSVEKIESEESQLDKSNPPTENTE
jgi:hypothetical protein